MSETPPPLSAPTESEAQQSLRYLVADYLPDSYWILEGAFRFDAAVRELRRNTTLGLGFRGVGQVAGAPPCLWSLDWGGQRRVFSQNEIRALLKEYEEEHVGVTLVFDNPCVAEAELDDTYGHMLVTELQNHNAEGRHALCVAHDALAESLRQRYPKLPVICHYNRLVAERGRRTPALYESLCKRYHRVMLHPADATRPSLYRALRQPERFDVVVNDSCLRTCPVRREHMFLLGQQRRAPYQSDLMVQAQLLVERVDCRRAVAPVPGVKARGFLTRKEAQELYAAGFRAFFVQGAQYRNEMTLLWDYLRCALDWQPALSNRTSHIAVSALAALKRHTPALTSGLRSFDFQQ